VGFRLENADLLQFISLVAGELKLNYLVDPAVKGAVTISTSGELKPTDLFPILETVLKMNGATAVKVGNFYRIVPLASAPRNPLGISTSGAELPPDDRMLMQIVPLKFVFATDMAKMLTPFLSEGGTVTVLDIGNTLILVDDSLNVKRLMDILQQFDSSAFATERVRLFPVRNNVASALAPELEAIFATYALSDKQTPLRFMPLDRINGILVAAADPAAFDEVEKWIEKLDQPATPNGVQTFVYKVQYSEAGRLVRLLNQLRGAGGGGGGGGGGEGEQGASGAGRGTARSGGGPASLQEATSQQAASEAASVATPFGPTGGQAANAAPEQPRVRIITDPVSNSIIVQGTPQDYADIAKTLDKLDVVPRQVLIEARVYEVDLTGTLSFGLEYALAHPPASTLTGPLQFQGDYGVGSSGSLTGSVGGWIGTRQLMAYLSSSENRTRVHTLSAPTVLTTDGAQARIQVGASVPVLTSQAIVAGAQSGSSSLFTNTVQNVDTGIILTVTPRVTSTGLVSLLINQEVSSEQPPASSGIQSPSFNKRSVTTQAVTQDGQTIALGGLISYTYTKTLSRFPLLGDIPWLGALFGSTNITSGETELIVLLTPRVISTLPGVTAATRELEDKLKDLRREFKKDALLKP
jgi:general secretion pathway protein D